MWCQIIYCPYKQIAEILENIFIGTISFLLRFQEATRTSCKFHFLSFYFFFFISFPFQSRKMSAPDFMSGNSGHHFINLFLRGLKMHFPDRAWVLEDQTWHDAVYPYSTERLESISGNASSKIQPAWFWETVLICMAMEIQSAVLKKVVWSFIFSVRNLHTKLRFLKEFDFFVLYRTLLRNKQEEWDR